MLARCFQMDLRQCLSYLSVYKRQLISFNPKRQKNIPTSSKGTYYILPASFCKQDMHAMHLSLIIP